MNKWAIRLRSLVKMSEAIVSLGVWKDSGGGIFFNIKNVKPNCVTKALFCNKENQIIF